MAAKIKRAYRLYRNYLKDYFETRVYQVQCYNTFIYDFNSYLVQKHTPNHWLYQFITNRIQVEKLTNNKIAIFGINGDRKALWINKAKYKIFYTAENIHDAGSFWSQFNDLFLQDPKVSLSIGFDYLENDKYVRFPFWMMRVFNPEDTFSIIKEKCNRIEQAVKINSYKKFCTFICRNDYNGDRLFFFNLINRIGIVDCPSQFQHNDETLKDLYNNNKLLYLSQYKFNLCPENSNYEGYVTEKIFDSVSAGCLPIYWGSNNKPEPNILNQNRILFLSLNNENLDIVNEISSLNKNDKKFASFSNQPVFTKEAPEIIFEYFKNLETKLTTLFSTLK